MLDHGTDSYYKISRAFVGGEPVGGLTRESIIDNITLYWFTGTAASAARSYWEDARALAAALASGQPPPPVTVPVGFTTFPGEIWASPRSWVEAVYPDLACQRGRPRRTLRMGRTSTLRVGTSRGVQVFAVTYGHIAYEVQGKRHQKNLSNRSMKQSTLLMRVRHEEKAMRKFSKDRNVIESLSPEQYRVTQQNGTEFPGSGEYLDNTEPGIYVDIVSGEPLFASSDKFESGCGWPSFTKPIEPDNINELRDTSHGMTRTEVRSAHGAAISGTYLPTGERPRRIALLHQLGLAAVHPSRRYGGRGLWRLRKPSGGPNH